MSTSDLNQEQLQKMKSHPGFIAALIKAAAAHPVRCGCTE